MIKKVILIIGLPGAGKTTLGTSLSKNLNAIFLDDISVLTNHNKDNLIALLSSYKDDSKHQTIIISDSFLCEKNNQVFAEEIIKHIYPKCMIVKKYFENDKQKSLHNVFSRQKNGDSRKVKDFIEYLSNKYYIPENTETIKIIT